MKRKILLAGLFLVIILFSLIVIKPELVQGKLFLNIKNLPKPVTQESLTNPSVKSNIPVSIYDANGRLTDLARSSAKTVSLDLSKLTKLYPEKSGNNYYSPGTYTVKVGDGVGNGTFLIKFMEFIHHENSSNSFIRAEVFKKEKDGNYYHFPTEEYVLGPSTANQLLGITIENIYPSVFDPNSVEIIYHASCRDFIDYCYDANSSFYAEGNPLWCNVRCPFEANTDEYKAQNGKYSAVFPAGYKDLTDTAVNILKQCDQNTEDFLKIDTGNPRIGLKMLLGNGEGMMTGLDEYVTTTGNKSYYDNLANLSTQWKSQSKTTKCPEMLELGHELTHVHTKELFGSYPTGVNFGLSEGIADYAKFQNGGTNGGSDGIICKNDGWVYPTDTGNIKAYVSLSDSPSSTTPTYNFYHTGYCFWQDFTKEYGYSTFAKLMQALYQKVRDTKPYYVLDVMDTVVGGKVKQEILDRYKLTRESTSVKICDGCEMFAAH